MTEHIFVAVFIWYTGDRLNVPSEYCLYRGSESETVLHIVTV